MDSEGISQLVRQCGMEAGFDRVGIAAAGPHPRGDYLRQWLADGRAGTMGYLHRHVESRIDVRAWLPDATHVIVVTLNYRQPSPIEPPVVPTESPRGRIAMYARGEDYHDVMRDKLNGMIAAMRDRIDRPFFARACVDTSAITERELAAAAGIGWIGKNTLVLNDRDGSFFFIGVILTDLPLIPDPPATDHCGTCTRCLDACPTRAFPAPYEMDASRCISYLTIEHRGDIDPALAAKMGDWLFGCDICQDVCPFNRKAPETSEPRLLARRPATAADRSDAPADRAEDIPARIEPTAAPHNQIAHSLAANDQSRTVLSPVHTSDSLDAAHVANWTDAECKTFTRGTALARAKPDMWRRNAAIVLANHRAAGRHDTPD